MTKETYKKKYVFISNSTRPSLEEAESRNTIPASNVHKPCLATAAELGYEVYLGVNRNRPEELEHEMGVHLYDSHTYRSLLDLKSNGIALKNLLNLLNKGDFEVIHCNTPIGGLVGRMGGLLKGVDKVIYTAHGFHFYEGAPLFNRTVLKAAERILARFTDAIITMNEEDYRAAQKFRLRKNGKVFFVPGVGLDVKHFANKTIERSAGRRQLGFDDQDFLFMAFGDLVKRKNYETSLHALALQKNPHVHLLIGGIGPEEESLKALAGELDISPQVHFLGYRTDVKQLLELADAFLFTTRQEGMPRSLMEAMASGLPSLVSKIRGNVDLLEEGQGGYLYPPDDAAGFAEGIRRLVDNPALCREMGAFNQAKVQLYDAENVKKELEAIYRDVLDMPVLENLDRKEALEHVRPLSEKSV